MKDFDYFIDKTTVTENVQKLRQVVPSRFGFHLSLNEKEYFDTLNSVLPEGALFPIQVCSGPMLTLRYWSAIPDYVQSLVKSDKIKLVLHLPFVLTWYKEPNILGYQLVALRELSDYLRSQGLLEKVTVLVHCGHPPIEPDGNLQVQDSYWTNIAAKNINSAASMFGEFLIENLPGHKDQVVDFSSVQSLYDRFLKNRIVLQNVHLAFDTEHHFAGGFTIADLSDECISEVKFIHLNAAPPNAEFGAYVDLHSYTTIFSSLERLCGPFCVPNNDLPTVLSRTQGIPCVFERKLMSVQLLDWEYCQSISK